MLETTFKLLIHIVFIFKILNIFRDDYDLGVDKSDNEYST